MSKRKNLKSGESTAQGNESVKNKKPGLRKRMPQWARAILITLGGAGGGAITLGGSAAVYDALTSKQRKNEDREQFGVMDVKRDSTRAIEGIMYTQYEDINGDGKIDQEEQTVLNISFQDIINHNKGLLGDGLGESSLPAIITGEDELKTRDPIGKLIQKWDDERLSGKLGIERSKGSESGIGRILGGHPGSYGPFQVQRESIDDYKGDEKIYNKLCNDIANFMLPNKNNEREKLYKQLGFPTPESMVEDIKNHQINMYEGGGRFGIAYGFVLINQIDKRNTSICNLYDGNKGYNRWFENADTVAREKNKETGKLKYPELTGKDDNIMNPYILKEKGAISYTGIGNIFNDSTFKQGMLSAYRCMNHIENVKNSNYLFWLELLELDEWFNNPNGNFDIVTNTGSFGPTATKLVNKYFEQNFDTDNEKGRKKARKFMDELPAEKLEELKEKGLNKFEQNMRLLYTLQEGDNKDKYGINQLQSKYLSECLDLTFNHMYAVVTVFSNFVSQNCGDKSGDISNLRHDYVKGQSKKSLEELKKIMTEEGAFISFTGLTRESYLKWTKYYLCPTVLASTDRVRQTGGIVPIIQENHGGTKKANEQNSIARFDIGVKLEQEAKTEQAKGIRHTVKGENGTFHMDYQGDSTLVLSSNPKEYVRRALFNDETVREYLQSKCVTSEGKKIVSSLSIPDELIDEMVRDENGDYVDIETIKPGDTIRFKIDGKTVYKYFGNLGNAIVRNNLGNITNRGGTIMCEDNLDGTYTVKPGANLQIILSECCEKDKRIKEEAIRVNNKLNKKGESSYGSRPENVIKEIIRDEKGNKLKNPKIITPDQKIRINGLSNETLCVENGDGTYTVQKGTTGQAILSQYSKENTMLHNIFIELNGGKPVEEGDIPAGIIIMNRKGEPVKDPLKRGDVIRIGFRLSNIESINNL